MKIPSAKAYPLPVTRYLGTYAGFTNCVDNNVSLPTVYDTAWITPDNVAINTVQVKLKSVSKVMHRYVTNTESVYSIVVTNNDSVANYSYIHKITLQADNTLSIHSYMVDYRTKTDSVVSNCTFLSSKKY